MPDVADDTWHAISGQAALRWQASDPLLPDPAARPAGCGASLVVTGPDGVPAAAATCEHWDGEPGNVDLSWGATRRFILTVQAAGDNTEDGLDGLLAQWRDHLAGLPAAGDEDTAVVVTWPCRDVTGIPALLRHGLAPYGVVAARLTRHDPAAPPGSTAASASRQTDDSTQRGGEDRAGDRRAPAASGHEGLAGLADLRIRRAGPGDIGEVVRLGLELIRFETYFGGIERPESADALRGEAARMLAGPEPWTWLAERDGQAVGLLAAQRPELAGWIAPMVRAASAAYLMLMFVDQDERGSGTAAALVDRLHRDVAAAGVPVTLLHYEQTNPLSGPFWSRRGYRPLWTSWEARPARALR